MLTENVLGLVRHRTQGAQGRSAAVRKRSDIETDEGRDAPPVALDEHSEHIIRYARVWRGMHFADFMRDKRVCPEVYHCIVQRQGSNEILSWTQDASLDAAMKNAEVFLTLLAGASVKA